MWNPPTEGRCVLVCSFVTSDGTGGTGGSGGTAGPGGTVPLGEVRGRMMSGPGSGLGAADSGMMSSLGK